MLHRPLSPSCSECRQAWGCGGKSQAWKLSCSMKTSQGETLKLYSQPLASYKVADLQQLHASMPGGVVEKDSLSQAPKIHED